MKRFTSEDLLKALELQVGDRVKFTDIYWNNCIYEIVFKDDEYFVKTEEQIFPLCKLLDREIKLLQRPKRVGDLKCTDEIECKYCPLRMANCTRTKNSTLYKLLEEIKGIALSGDYFDQEIYDLLKTRLDKEVE